MAVISFFSYKGGSGRTTTTLNTLYYLIRKVRPTPEHPLVVIDADSESYGLSMLLKDRTQKSDINKSLQALLLRAQQNTFVGGGNPTDMTSYRNLVEYFTPVGNYFTNDIANDAVLLLSSDVTPSAIKEAWNETFVMNKLELKTTGNLSQLLGVLNDCKCTVVFDTPSGTQDLAAYALDSSDIIVCCMRPSVQFERGTRQCFGPLFDSWKEVNNFKNIIFCPSAVPYKNTVIDGNTYPEHYVNTTFGTFYTEMQTKANDTHGVVNIVWDMREGAVPGIPEVERFKWQECCLEKVAEGGDDEKLAKEKYEKLAKIIYEYSPN